MYDAIADWYDRIYAAAGKDYAAEAAAVTALVRRLHPGAASLLDVACGTGGHLEHLAETFRVEGLDGSAAMVAQARRRLPGVPIAHADMRAFDLGRSFDAVTCLFSAIGHCTHEADLRRAVAAMAAHLAPGGLLLVEGWVTIDDWQDGHVGMLAGGDEHGRVMRMNTAHRDGTHLRLTFHHLLGTPQGIKHVVASDEFGLFTRAQYLDAFRAAGLADVAVDDQALTGRGVYTGRRRAWPEAS